MLSDAALARQRAATCQYWRESVQHRPGGAWADLGGVQVHTTGLAPRHWNGAVVTRQVDLAPLVPQVGAWFAARDKPWGLLVPAELDVEPPQLRYVLDQPVMLRGLGDLPDVGDLIVRDDAPAADVAGVQAEAFGDGYDLALAYIAPLLLPGATPPQRTITAYDGDGPVGCGTVAFLSGVAGIYGIAVRERARRQGIGASLTAHCLRLAADAGCDLAYLNPSDIGYGVYARLGFEDAPPLRIWVPD
jgi:GNAT superfamily N-acetyltransferase